MNNQKVSENCKKYVSRVYRRVGQNLEVTVFQPRCKSWDCGHCRATKADATIKRVRSFVESRQTWMYTLTFYHDDAPLAVWRRAAACWNLLRTKITQYCGKFEFIRVVESHEKSPYPHFHIIADVNIPETLFGRLVVESGFGFQMDKKKIAGEQMSRYIAKYLSKAWKNQEGWEMRKWLKIRLVSYSRGLALPGEIKEPFIKVTRAASRLHNPEVTASAVVTETRGTVKLSDVRAYGRGYVLVFEPKQPDIPIWLSRIGVNIFANDAAPQFRLGEDAAVEYFEPDTGGDVDAMPEAMPEGYGGVDWGGDEMMFAVYHGE